MGRFPGEQLPHALVWAVLDLLITHQTNGIRFNQLDRQRLKRIRTTSIRKRPPSRSTPPRLTTTGNRSRRELTTAKRRDPTACSASALGPAKRECARPGSAPACAG